MSPQSKNYCDSYDVSDLVGHIAHELDDQAAHFEIVGAPRRAAYFRNDAEALREVKAKIASIQY